MLLVLPEPLAPMVEPLPLVVVSVLAVPLEEAPGVVLVVPLAAAPLLELPLGVVVLGLPLGPVVVALVEGAVLPGEAPAAAGVALESVVPDPLLLGVCAMAQPPDASAAAAARVARVCLVVLISLLLELNPEGA